MLATLGLIASLGIGGHPQPMDHLRLYRDLQGTPRARVSVWLDHTSPYGRGDRARVYISTDEDAFITVLRIDTDGRVRVLFPEDPWDDNSVPAGRTFEVEDRDGGRAFRVDDAPGVGYIFAVASSTRFDYTPILTQRDHWDYSAIADGQVRGDPYVAVTDLAERIVPTGDYDYDLAQYDVERHYDYPRFVCYDCHAYAPYYTWNPYAHTCVRFRVVIYDDPYYYPYRYYGGRRVVVVRPRRPQPRYVFVDNNGSRDYVTRIPTRPRREDGVGGTGNDEMRPRRGEDIGGRGSIPVPGGDRRRIIRQPDQRPTDPGQGQPERRERPRTEAQPPGLRPQPRVLDDPSTRNEPRRDDPKVQKPDPRAEPRREEPRREEPRREEPRREEPRREEPRREEPRREEPRREEPRHEEPRREEPRREEPRREPSRGGGRSSNPELRRRRG